MSDTYRATPEHWAAIERAGSSPRASIYEATMERASRACIRELRARVEELEADALELIEQCPKPPSLKEQELAALQQVGNSEDVDNATFETISRALEAQSVAEETDIHYSWELQDAEGEWQAGGSAITLESVRREGNHHLQTYLQDGLHVLIIYRVSIIEVVTND